MKAASIVRTLILLGILFGIQKASGAQVNWGTTRFADNYTSELKPLGSENAFTFEIGSFAEGFVPTADNADQWAANWTTAGQSEYSTNFQFAAGSAPLSQEITAGSRGYIWGYDQRDGELGEWILITDPTWIWQSGDATSTPQDWTAGSASEAVVGKLGSSQDPFHLQTAALVLTSESNEAAEAWRNEHFAGELDSDIAAWDADADQDGMANALEFAFGTDPRNSNDAIRATVANLTEAGATYMTFQFDAEPNADAPLIIEVSNDLDTWSAAGSSAQVTSGNGQLQIRDTIPTSNGRRFFRLSVNL